MQHKTFFKKYIFENTSTEFDSKWLENLLSRNEADKLLGRFCSIEPKVGVNHGGTVLMRDILDFGESGYIPLDEDTEPNFLGDEMTPSEFAEEEVQDETLQMGGM